MTRRMMSGSYKTLKMMERCEGRDDGTPDYEQQRLELQKERQRFFDQRREYNKLVVETGRRENLEDRLVDVANGLNKSIGKMYGTDPILRVAPDGGEAVLVLCDWHYGMVTENIWNTYNTDICRDRVRSVVLNAIDRIEAHRCRKLHVFVLGDLIHGGIHVSARVASEELVCEQIMHVAEILAQSIEELSLHVGETHVYLTYGNHARSIPNKKDNLHRDNMERLIPWWLSQRLRDHEDVIIEPESEHEFILANVCGRDICASHGDLDTVRGAPRLLSTLFQKKYGRDIQYVILADKHHREEFEELGVESMICGSLCGTDEYANLKRLYAVPSQLLLIFNDKDGLDDTYKLRCTRSA